MDEKLMAAWAKVKELWAKNKILFFIIIPLLILAKFRDVIIDLLVSSANRLVGNTKNKDGELSSEINQANQQANELIDQANKRNENKPLVDEDWYKK